MHVELISLSGIVYAGAVDELRLPTRSGEIGILPHHEDLVTVLTAGTLEVVSSHDKTQSYVVFGGLATISPDKVEVLVDEVEPVDGLVEREIEAALVEAQRLEASAENVHQEIQASRNVIRHTARLRAVRRHRRI